MRYGRPASVLMIDSDNLKTVNDTHGHEAGNRLLRQLANAVQAELRATDVPARYGGDEFIVLLPETPPKGALDVAERIRNAIAARPLAIDGQRITATVSIGIACYPRGRPHARRARRARRPRALPGEAGNGAQPLDEVPLAPPGATAAPNPRASSSQYSPVSLTPKLACFSLL